MKPIFHALVASFIALTVQAHDLVLIPLADSHQPSLRIKFGHVGEWEAPEIHRLFTLDAYPPQANGISLLNEIKTNGIDFLAKADSSSTVPPGTWVMVGSYDNGFWVHTVEDKVFFNTAKTEYPSAKSSGHFLKFAKALIAQKKPSTDYNRRIGYRIELVPMTDPFSVKIGQNLPVQAFYEGKPLVGVGLEIGDGKTKIKEEDIPRFKTDANGVAQIPITHGGLEVIAVDYKTPSRTPDASDEDNYSSTLTFVASPNL